MEGNNPVRPSALRPSGAYRSPSGKSSPRSPAFRRLGSSRNSYRDGKTGGFNIQWIRSNRILLWLLLITLWTYGGFYVQSRWAHGDNKDGIFGGDEGQGSGAENELGQNDRRNLVESEESIAAKIQVVKALSNSNTTENLAVSLAEKKKGGDSKIGGVVSQKKKAKKSTRGTRKKSSGKPNVAVEAQKTEIEVVEEEIPMQNTTYGMLVGPFGTIEDRILEWSPEKRTGTCERNSQFGKLAWSRKFVLIFHELSMTGAPLAMMELATELLSCGATVSVVVLSKRGGLMQELVRRKIKVLEDKLETSFKTAAKADLIIAGSAVCSSWIEKYREHTVLGASQIAWWIMENRREYFDRAKLALSHVKKLIFLSESQSKNWLDWIKEENIKIRSEPAVLPLSVNDELAFVAGISCSLNTPGFTTEKMMEKKQLLRDSVRKEMGLRDDDMLAVSLSSINPGKGQFLFLESARLVVIDQERPPPSPIVTVSNNTSLESNKTHHSKPLLSLSQKGRKRQKPIPKPKIKLKRYPNHRRNVNNNNSARKLLTETRGIQLHHQKKLKFLIGSVGSKSNKVSYVKELLQFLSQHSNLSQSVMWTPATTRVASLYSAADVYVMNAQGVGETFGRVTIEAMAFGLPVLGTDAGGTKEIVEHNVTGLLHPLGRPGTVALAKNLRFLLENPSRRQQMGLEGRKKVEKMFMKKHMYKKFGEILYDCLRIK